jgi:arylsulfatase A-like enzyme
MRSPIGISRVILVVLDGLRPDAIERFELTTLKYLAARGAHTLRGTTVEPSITAAAISSIFSGVHPHVHRIRSERIGIPRPTEPLTLLPRLLRDHGVPMYGHLAALPRPFRGLGSRLAAHVGANVTFAGNCAEEILDQAIVRLDRERNGVFFLHWPDADIAGHADGWMSPSYARGAAALDGAMARLVQSSGVLDDPSTVLIAFADHGGGGVIENDHGSRHPLDLTIPIVMVGGQVMATELAETTSLVDIPATVPWLLGIPAPANYAGRALTEGFAPVSRPIAA